MIYFPYNVGFVGDGLAHFLRGFMQLKAKTPFTGKENCCGFVLASFIECVEALKKFKIIKLIFK